MTEKDTRNGAADGAVPPVMTAVTSTADLKAFLRSVLDKMSEEQAAPIYCVSLMNYLLNMREIYDYLDGETKELARDVWLRLKASGLQLRNPPVLFGEEPA